MYVVRVTRVNAGLSPERHEHQPETVERGQARGQDTQHRENLAQRAGVPGRQQQGVFTEKARGQGKAGQSQRADHKSPIRNGHALFQTAHAPYVLLMMNSQNNGPAPQKQ